MISRFLAPLRVLAQTLWPAHGDVDDCWVLAALMGVNHVAPWLWLVNTTQFRTAAGRPDDPDKGNPGSVADAAKAVRALYPQLKVTLVTTWSWAKASAFFKAGHGAYLSVLSGALPPALQFGFKGAHAIYAYCRDGKFYVDNPLAKAHSSAVEISEADLQKAALAHPSAGDGINALFFPTTDEAFQTHPLLKGVVDAAVKAALSAVAAPADQLAAAAEAGARGEWDRQNAGATVALLPRP